MENLSYNVSEEIREQLQNIDLLRSRILTASIPPSLAQNLRYRALVNRIFYSYVLSNAVLGKSEVVRALNLLTPEVGRVKKESAEILAYKKALDFIAFEWTGSTKPITIKTILSLYRMFGQGRVRSHKASVFLKKFLQVMEKSSDHPIVKASLLYILIHKNKPFTSQNEQMAHLAFQLVLCKYGYDMKGLPVIQFEWKEDFNAYTFALTQTFERGNATIWIEFVAKTTLLACRKVLDELGQEVEEIGMIKGLTERQTAILEFSNRGGMVTNRKIQKLFKISQITASRDLSYLASRNLLLQKGKGRSVFYTKI